MSRVPAGTPNDERTHPSRPVTRGKYRLACREKGGYRGGLGHGGAVSLSTLCDRVSEECAMPSPTLAVLLNRGVVRSFLPEYHQAELCMLVGGREWALEKSEQGRGPVHDSASAEGEKNKTAMGLKGEGVAEGAGRTKERSESVRESSLTFEKGRDSVAE